jgi:hypothetical protein
VIKKESKPKRNKSLSKIKNTSPKNENNKANAIKYRRLLLILFLLTHNITPKTGINNGLHKYMSIGVSSHPPIITNKEREKYINPSIENEFLI